MKMQAFGGWLSYVLGWFLVVLVNSRKTNDSHLVLSVLRPHNPTITWDSFLEHLARKRAKCKFVGKKHALEIKKPTRDGVPIRGFVDGVTGNPGGKFHEKSHAISALIKDTSFLDMVVSSSAVGCYSNYECTDRSVTVCYFIGSLKSENEVVPKDEAYQAQEPRQPARLGQVRAFTEEQYRLAEGIMRVAWDRTHFLENLAGVEADCAMVERTEWPWTTAATFSKSLGYELRGATRTAPNEGDTESAMRLILQDMKEQVVNQLQVYSMGCTLIPNCPVFSTGAREEDVLIACVFRLLPSRGSNRFPSS